MKKIKKLMKKILPNSFYSLLVDLYSAGYIAYYHHHSYKKYHQAMDYFIVSFPKSGRTWLRTILAKYFELEFGTDFNLELQQIKKESVPKIAFSHWIKDVKLHQNKKVIYLLRDPRDVVISYYHHRRHRSQIFEDVFYVFHYDNLPALLKSYQAYRKSRKELFSQELSSFIRNDFWGLPQIIKVLNLMHRYSKYPSSVHILTYEDLKQDAFEEVSKLLEFMEIKIDDQHLEQAIDFSSFDKMQSMEKAGKFADPRLTPGDNQNLNSFKVRKGKVGSYREELSQEDMQYLNQTLTKNLCPEMKKIFGIV